MEHLSEIITAVGGEIGLLLAAVIGGVIIHAVNYVKDAYKKRKGSKRESIPRMVENDVEIYKLLSAVMMTTKASRASVFQFHNGTHYVNTASQMKMSCTHEMVADGISKEVKNMQNLLISQYATTVNTIISNPFTTLRTTNHENEDFIQILRSQGVDTAIFAPFSRGTDIEGYISISYLDSLSENFPEESDSSIEARIGYNLSECSLRIGYLLRKSA